MRDLFFLNSQTRRHERFTPADPAHVRMYVCGPTVYDLPHLGNLRATVVFDVVARLLRALYPRVTYVRNITDIDDKIFTRANEQGEPIAALTARTTLDYHADMAAIGNLPPDVEPRATAHVPEMIAVIERLIEAGHAYAADSHVLFKVSSFDQYGALSGRLPDELLAGARVEVAPYKQDAGDFVLWKPSTPDLPGWDSPWGRGRPGWHIECSAMAWRYLGENFDIHGGGTDLIFPHHENERAQSLCAFPGSHFARMWLHNGMLQVNGEKMSKSLGNFFTLRDVLSQAPAGRDVLSYVPAGCHVLARAPAEAIRLLMLRTHYRALLDFTESGLAEARQEMDRFYRAIERASSAHAALVPDAVMDAMCDDLNTPAAVAAMRVLADAAMAGDAQAASGLLASGALLGILQMSPDMWFGRTSFRDEQGTPEEIEAAIAERRAARADRDFKKADEIRKFWAEKGVLMEDSPAGTSWRRQ